MLAILRPDLTTQNGSARAVTPFRRAVSNPKAPRFREVADTPGITGTALRVWIETSHPTMPNIIVEKDDMLNVIAYILSLKGRDKDQNQ
jgi:hypothetical protein